MHSHRMDSKEGPRQTGERRCRVRPTVGLCAAAVAASILALAVGCQTAPPTIEAPVASASIPSPKPSPPLQPAGPSTPPPPPVAAGAVAFAETVIVDAGSSPVAAPTAADIPAASIAVTADPYANTIVSLRARGVACLRHLEHGHYAATMVITVRSSGTVAHANVEEGNVFNDVAIACLNDVAKNSEFPFVEAGGRTVRIDVRHDREEWPAPTAH